MAVPLLVTWRAVFSYIVSGLTHKLSLWCEGDNPGGTYVIKDTTGGTTYTLSTVVAAMATALEYLYPNTDPTGLTLTLEEKVGLAWIPRGSASDTMDGSLGTANFLTSQGTVVLRDISGHMAKVVFMEGAIIPPYHYVTSAGAPTAVQNFLKEFTSAAVQTGAPWHWMLSRGGNAMQDSPLIGFTGDLNDKIRRARGLV